MRSFTFMLLAALISFTSAQSTTNLFLPGFDGQQIFASVIGSDSSATTYAIACADATQCGLYGPFTLTEGPSTAHYTVNISDLSATVDCSIDGMVSAFCTGTFTGSGTSDSLSTTVAGTELAGYFIAATVTDKLPASAEASTTVSSGSSGGTTGASSTITASTSLSAVLTSIATKTSTASTSTASTSSSSSLATASTGASPTSTAGVPQVTGSAGWVLGGMALALVIVGL